VAPAVCEASSPPQPNAPNSALTATERTTPRPRATTELTQDADDDVDPALLTRSF